MKQTPMDTEKSDPDYEQRHFKFEGCFNFRDIGGYVGTDGKTVAWGQYLRSGRQDRMTDADLARVAQLKINTQIDLRREEEVSSQGRGPLSSLGASYVFNSVLTDHTISNLNRETGITGTRYLGYLQYDLAPWQRLFTLLSDPSNYPVLVHCTAGKDRTGVTTALILSVLGVDRSVIEADFVLTNREVERQVTFVENGPGIPRGMSREAFVYAAGVREDAMDVFLKGLDERYGGPMDFLRSIGIDDSMQQSMRDILLTDESEDLRHPAGD